MAKSFNRSTTIKDVPLSKIVISGENQRRCNESRVDHLFADFEPDQIGYLLVNERDGKFFLIDGQHRFKALIRWLGTGWETQKLACACYSGLTESQEAEMFLRHNDTLAVNILDRFKVAVSAKRPLEIGIKNVVESLGLHIGYDMCPGRVAAVGTLKRVVERSDLATLGRSLKILRDSYGDAGMDAHVIDGMGHLCKRYNGTLDESKACERLGAARGGVRGLLNRAEEIRLRTGNTKGVCVAAAAVDIIKTGKGGQKLPSWWAE